MGRNTRKVNFLIEEDLCRELEELIPSGKRSQVINEALRKELELVRRKKAVEQLLASRTAGKKFSNREILGILAEDRNRQ